MNQILKIRDGEIKTIYSDEILPHLNNIGKVIIKRATHVEFDNNSGFWRATTADLGEDNFTTPGVEIAVTKTRKEAIDREIEFLRRNL